MAVARLSGMLRGQTQAGIPERLKGGRIERYVDYWKGVMMDYREAGHDVVKGCREKPVKAMVYGFLGLSAFYANKTKMSLREFVNSYTEVNHDLTLVSDNLRNPASQEHQLAVNRAMNEGQLRSWNLGVATLIWCDRYDESYGHVKARCKYLQPSYLEVLQERVVDVGFLGRWWITDKMMAEFDVNPDEWDDKGRPRGSQLKHMW